MADLDAGAEAGNGRYKGGRIKPLHRLHAVTGEAKTVKEPKPEGHCEAWL